MQYETLNLIYFSATGTTQTIVRAIASGIELPIQQEINLINAPQVETTISNKSLTIFGVPVFSGRVPEIAHKALSGFKGENAPAIIVCVYGNREFDDALIELNDLIEGNGFTIASAAAFIAQHSIFPKIASGRPDTSDLAHAKAFGTESIDRINASFVGSLSIKGNRPYRPIKAIPLNPRTQSNCNGCGLCAQQCPTQAIDRLNPKRIDRKRCISCAHCIAVCPKKAKAFGGVLYYLVSKKFVKNFSKRKAPYTLFRS